MSTKRAALWASVTLASMIGWFSLLFVWLPGFLMVGALIFLSVSWFLLFCGFLIDLRPQIPPPPPTWEDKP